MRHVDQRLGRPGRVGEHARRPRGVDVVRVGDRRHARAARLNVGTAGAGVAAAAGAGGAARARRRPRGHGAARRAAAGAGGDDAAGTGARHVRSDQRNRALGGDRGAVRGAARSSRTPGSAVERARVPQVHAHDRPRGRSADSAADRRRPGVGEVAGVDVVGQHRRVPGRAGERAAPRAWRAAPAEGRKKAPGPPVRRGDPVAAALDLRPAPRPSSRPASVRVRPGVVAQLVAVGR